jgi:hypothetical protein
MPVDALHREVAAVALRVAGRYGFALGGGNALIAHGVISRVTQDVDLFTDREDGVAAVADGVAEALAAAGFAAERQDEARVLLTSSRGWGTGWPSGLSPRLMVGRWCCSWPISIVAGVRW